jgi:hypothetical protein
VIARIAMADNATRATVRAKSVNAAGILDATDLVTVDALALAPVLVTANVPTANVTANVSAAGILDATDLVTVDALALAPVLVTANVAEFVGRDDDMLD